MKKKYLTWRSFGTAPELVDYINATGHQEGSIRNITYDGERYYLFIWKWY